MMREYIVTCKTKEDLESLYEDMETPGGNLHIPDRAIELVHRRPISRNTHYMLTDEEALQIKQDDRVLDVALTPEERGVEVRPQYTIDGEITEDENQRELSYDPSYTISSNRWSKTTNNNDTFRNWGMIRCVNEATFPSWGNDNQPNIANGATLTCQFTSTGRNVDVVIVDGYLDPNHPEFAVNENGTGGTRVEQFNWFSLNPSVTGASASTYLYKNLFSGSVTYDYSVVNNGSGAYTFSGSATGDNPTLSVKQGDILNFSVNASGHPFWIKTSNTTGTSNLIDTGTILNNGTQSGTVTWNTNGVEVGTYYYICQYHSGMVGTINVTAGTGTGTYTNGTSAQLANNNHGNHVAGTACGNRRGWGRETNIYNINPYGSATSLISSSNIIDYIREWHNTKPINPETGKANPTITNHSYGIFYNMAISDIDYVIYRGTQYNAPLTSTQLTGFGLVNNGTSVLSIPYLSTANEADIQDAIFDGIIFIGAAGNSSFKIDSPGGEDYDNVIKQVGYTAEYYHRGTSPTCITNFVTVGAISELESDEKASYSNCGPGVNVYAPGTNIISSVLSGGVTDSRNSTYRVEKYPGTSMASPQVAGVVACLAEHWPRITQSEVLAYFNSLNPWSQTHLATLNQIGNTATLQGSENRYLKSPKVRKVPAPSGASYTGAVSTSQQTWPRLDNKFRPILNYAYDIDRDGSTIVGGDIDEDIHSTKMVYPRHPIWSRKLN